MSDDFLPPQNMEAEQAVLGSILLDPLALDRAAAILTGACFYRDMHRAIWDAAVTLDERSTTISGAAPIDLITMQAELESRGQFEDIGGFVYLQNLMEAPSSAANIEYYAQLVYDKYLLRRVLDAAAQMRTAVRHPDDRTASEIVERAETLVRDINLQRGTADLQPLQEILHERLDELEKRYSRKTPAGFQTPFDDYNYLTQGLHPDELTIVAGRPGMGKSAMLLQLALHHARCHGHTALFSLEMSAGQLVERMLGSEARVDSHRIRSGYLTPDDWSKIGASASELNHARLHIDETAAMTIHELRRKCRRTQATIGLSLVCVDYLQLLAGSPGNKQNRVTEIGEVARGLKQISRELHIPVIALAQISRAVETRPDKRPILSDLRESGSIEADADVVVFLYRDAYYNHEQPDSEDASDPYADPGLETAECIVAKQRSGPTGAIKLGWIGRYTRFEELTTRQHTQESRRTPYSDD